MKRTLFVIGWLICSFFGYGIALGSMDHRFSYQKNFGIAIILSALGPVDLVGEFISYPLSGMSFHWKLAPSTTEQRWQEFHKELPNLDRDYFEQKYD